MQNFVHYALVFAIAAGSLVVSVKAYAFGHPWTQLAQVTLDPPDRQPGATSGTTRPVTPRPESRPAALPVPSVTLDPPVNQGIDQSDELGLASASPITSIGRPERDNLPRSQPSAVEQSAPASPSPTPATTPPPPAPASPAASIQPPPAQPAPVQAAPVPEPRNQDKKDNRGRREENSRGEKWSGGGDKKGYQDRPDRADGPDGPYRIERADKVERAERVEKVDKVEKIEIVRPERVEKIDKSGRPDRVERLQKVEKPERGKK